MKKQKLKRVGFHKFAFNLINDLIVYNDFKVKHDGDSLFLLSPYACVSFLYGGKRAVIDYGYHYGERKFFSASQRGDFWNHFDWIRGAYEDHRKEFMKDSKLRIKNGGTIVAGEKPDKRFTK